jgi:hypothetical protein
MIIGVDIREWQPEVRTGIGRFLEELMSNDRFLLCSDAAREVRVQTGNLDVIRVPERWTLWWDQVSPPRALAWWGADILYSAYIKAPVAGQVPVANTIHA